MKTATAMLTLIFLASAGLMSSCSSSSGKTKKPPETLNESQKAVDDSYNQYLKEVAEYREQTKERIADNRKAISEHEQAMKKANKSISKEHAEQIARLEKKNDDLQKRLDEYKYEDQTKWSVFKEEFGRDMDELGKAFKDLTVNNVK